GVLILSEMAGASKELSDSLLINQNDINAIVEAMHKALTMPVSEQVKRNTIMQRSLKRYTIHHWVALFMERLKDVKALQRSMTTKQLDLETVAQIREKYRSANRRLIFLDYDGTLSPFRPDPSLAKPEIRLRKVLKNLSEDVRNRVVIISGRDRSSLEKWMGEFMVDLISEHGVWLKEYGKNWETIA